jgi:hypothetical protein
VKKASYLFLKEDKAGDIDTVMVKMITERKYLLIVDLTFVNELDICFGDE